MEIRSPLRRRSDMLPPRPPTKTTSMTKLASQLSPKSTTVRLSFVSTYKFKTNQCFLQPPADLRRTTRPAVNLSSNNVESDSDIQDSPRTFFTRVSLFIFYPLIYK